MASYSVYIHTNKINGKKYIGITNQTPVSRRWKGGYGYKKSPLFWKAIQKYGWENFNHTIEYQNLEKEDAEKIEQELIKKYKSNDRKLGYNIQKGGGISSLSELTKYKLRNANIGKHHSKETKLKMSKAHKGKQYCLGYKHNEETKEKHRILWLKNNNPRAKRVNQYDLDGNYIKTFNCMEDIKKELNIKSTCHISDCCRGIRNKCCGFIWKYSN